ncbi:hypothetical protein LOK49_LG15G00969 [Camellia lanceoleosa]|uniref:Uncharacterized protein n=1 Tax=Camellia lanceoleosa TaxID=1840588 RepID=A0ACC0F7C8_9ERIC|nr:hypothetical protein LOK49_LG15G00969 [Camellia lanceoleosa]
MHLTQLDNQEQPRANEMPNQRNNEDRTSKISTEDYNKAVDDLVNVNKLFTLAVFLGLALATAEQHSLENRAECDAGTIVAKRLILFEVLSFSCFISSTVVVMAIKLHLNIHGGSKHKIREMMVFVAGLATFFAYFFLMLSMVDIIQIRLGKLSCRDPKSLGAAVSVISIISSALVVFMFLMLPPLFRSISHIKS